MIIIRRPENRDVHILYKLFEDTLIDAFERESIHMPDLLESEMEEKKAFLMEDLNTGGKARFFLIAEMDGVIAGTICIGASNPLIHEETNGALDKVLEIGTVFVHPDYQKRGIATLMVDSMLAVLLGRGEESFCLDSGYKIAQGIWIKRFGQPEFLNVNKWGEGNPHMIWHKRLSQTGLVF